MSHCILARGAALQPDTFRKKWNTRQGTGGAVLRELIGLPPRVRALLDVAWDLTVEYGHASHIPVLTSVGSAREKGESVKTMSFAGQYAGPFDAKLLDHIVRIYALSAFAACEAMNVALRVHMRDSTYWSNQYEELVKKLNARASVPASWVTKRGIALTRKLRGDA